ncbi:MAG: hypothetical protein FJ139_05300 [Deltaproteobacteria bacterium]|nr:hypothetical protein [Deltaproteobacteria bacterium]
MRILLYVHYNLLLITVLVIMLSGCAGISQQYRASDEGISANYNVKKEQLISPKEKVVISSIDRRVNKEIIGEGAKPTVGTRVFGYVAFGVIYYVMPGQPTYKDQQDPITIFKTAMTERLSKNGVVVTNNHENGMLILELLVRQFKLDFNFGKWNGEVGYIARVKKSGEIICESNIYEKATAFNLYGFGSGERAISEAFNKAIDRLDVNDCFSKFQK